MPSSADTPDRHSPAPSCNAYASNIRKPQDLPCASEILSWVAIARHAPRTLSDQSKQIANLIGVVHALSYSAFWSRGITRASCSSYFMCPKDPQQRQSKRLCDALPCHLTPEAMVNRGIPSSEYRPFAGRQEGGRTVLPKPVEAQNKSASPRYFLIAWAHRDVVQQRCSTPGQIWRQLPHRSRPPTKISTHNADL